MSSRRGVRSAYQAYYLDKFRRAGVQVEISHEDITQSDGCARLISNCVQLGPLGGVFHLAMVLKDAVLENQTSENFRESSMAKYHATRNLDRWTRDICGVDLEWLVE